MLHKVSIPLQNTAKNQCFVAALPLLVRKRWQYQFTHCTYFNHPWKIF